MQSEQRPNGSGAGSSGWLAVNPPVFFISGALLLIFVGFGVFFTETAQVVFPAALDFVSTQFGWFYLLAVASFVVFSIWLLTSPYGGVRLGADDERPAYSTLSWFSMLFSAGMGIGLLFYSVAEPINHYVNPPQGTGRTLESARQALATTFFHWGLHAWAIYVVMGLAIAYFSYRRQLPIALRSTLHPLLGRHVFGWPGHLVDILAVFGTLFGLATSLGLGAMQINAGLAHLFDVPETRTVQLILIALITGAATISLITGVDKGIRRLSELNMLLALVLLLFVLFVGPTARIFDGFTDSLGRYFSDFVGRTFRLDVYGKTDWYKNNTLFYWGWWIAWAPFVGMFIARISRGRTIREFVLGVTLVPTLVTFIWMSVFGQTALHLEVVEQAGLADAVQQNVATAIFVMLQKLPLGGITALVAVMLVAVFFVTSSDSASFVVDMLTSGGIPDPPIWQRTFWAVSEGLVAAALLMASGKEGLSALQAVVVTVGAPFSLVMIAMMVSLVLGLRSEPVGRDSSR